MNIVVFPGGSFVQLCKWSKINFIFEVLTEECEEYNREWKHSFQKIEVFVQHKNPQRTPGALIFTPEVPA